MQMKIIAIAVRFACNEIGLDWRRKQNLAAFAAGQQGGKAVS